jgi:hypothetical protein
MRQVDAGDGGAGPHRKAFGQADAGIALAVEQAEKRRLLGVIGLRRIAGRRADAAIGLADQLVPGRVSSGA